MFRKLLQKISAYIQTATGSYKRHNAEYAAEGKLEQERANGLKNLKEDMINGPEMKVKDLLALHPHVRHAIDVGSGTGWSSVALSPLVDKVIAIEPSAAAVNISKSLYPEQQYPNIVWIEGFAEKVIPTLSVNDPTLFLTGCVLSHIRDKEVSEICSAINQNAPIGSVLSFAECWGEESWHQLMWHVRTKQWWQEELPGWNLTFHGQEIPEKDTYKGRYHKGFWGVKEN